MHIRRLVFILPHWKLSKIDIIAFGGHQLFKSDFMLPFRKFSHLRKKKKSLK